MQCIDAAFCNSQYFYEEQLHRMECLSQEPVLFEDVLCQMHDMIQPRCPLVARTYSANNRIWICLAGLFRIGTAQLQACTHDLAHKTSNAQVFPHRPHAQIDVLTNLGSEL